MCRNSDNIIQCVQTQKERNAHSTFFNKFLNMINRNIQISIKENVFSAYSDQFSESRVRISHAQIQIRKQIFSVNFNQSQKITKNSQTQKQKTVSLFIFHHQSQN